MEYQIWTKTLAPKKDHPVGGLKSMEEKMQRQNYATGENYSLYKQDLCQNEILHPLGG